VVGGSIGQKVQGPDAVDSHNKKTVRRLMVVNEGVKAQVTSRRRLFLFNQWKLYLDMEFVLFVIEYLYCVVCGICLNVILLDG
jgi:hypothetical protein